MGKLLILKTRSCLMRILFNLAHWNRRSHNRYLKNLGRQMDVMDRFRDAHDSRTTATFLESQYNKLILQEDTYWRQRAKMNCLKDGDMNTKCFHQSATTRNNFKEIVKMRRGTIEVCRTNMF